MKKLITTLVLAVSVALCFGMVACAVEPCETHTYENGKCTVCKYECLHETYLVGECLECGIACSHTGGTATCIAGKTCEVCGEEYGDVDTTAHVGGTATCTTGKICDECGEEYGDVDATAHVGGTATCTTGKICDECGEEYTDADSTAHVGGTATCVSGKVCTACQTEYTAEDPTVHAGEIEWTTTDTKHSSAWSCCDEPVVVEEDHEWLNGACVDCLIACPPHVHNFVEGTCSICGDAQVLYANGLTAEMESDTLVYSINGAGQNIVFDNVDGKKWLSFDFMMNSTQGYAYLQVGYNDYDMNIDIVKAVVKSTGEKVEFTATNWTGENVMQNGVWYTVLVNTNGYDFWFKHWASETGTTKIANINFLDISTKSGSALSIDVVNGETVYTLNKVAGGNCNQYGDNAFWFTTGEAETLTFDLYSADFNYFQLCAGNGNGYMEFDVYNKVKIINKSNGQEIEYTDPSVEGGIWTGEVLPTSTWLTVTVDVAGIQDLGIIYWASAAGTAQITNIVLD